MQRTLLDFTQDVLSSMGSDEVNSINDTLESQSVSKIVRRSFYNIVDKKSLTGQKDLFSLESYTDSSKPTFMTKPADVRNIDWVKYDKQTLTDPITAMSIVEYKEPDQFLYMMAQRNEDDPEVQTFTHTFGSSTQKFMVMTTYGPRFYTSFDDNLIVFDAYDAQVDTVLQKIKTQCYGEKNFVFNLTDSFIPPLNDEQQNLLLNEAISTAWVELKQSANPKSELHARKGWIRQQHTNKTIPSKISGIQTSPNYGRK